MTERTKEKDNVQVANEIRDSEEVIAPENTSANPLEASSRFPEFECYFKGCGQRFSSQRELIAHMDKESAERSSNLTTDDEYDKRPLPPMLTPLWSMRAS
jgi:hypothetical protein